MAAGDKQKTKVKFNPMESLADLRHDGLPLFLVPVVMRVFHTYSPCLE